ncbi:hypothetical protein QFC22_000203 [Naganishia vaughanmartiniae]|uniref:Uncharacterized protein n=1 Tax=Naganishia vaughanmartiniae TaxID=1424756 RepID=A0ACC2XN22_9TREE|nr:hypothetical protein QFC22_000203 [Naganishia vaughanmartiniae]
MSGNNRDLEQLVAKDASDFIRELEVERILRAFKLNPYDILDLPVGATDNEVKKQYRKKSLLIHPDKYKHDRGLEAEAALGDEKKRPDIDGVMAHARHLVIKDIVAPGVNPSTVKDDDPRLADLNPSLDSRIRTKSKEVFVEEELARRRAQKLQYANEGAEAAKKDAELREKKRKKEQEEEWESRRDDRISSWRSFHATPTSAPGTASSSSPAGEAMGAPPKKKKKKLNVLG